MIVYGAYTAVRYHLAAVLISIVVRSDCVNDVDDVE